jgi:single-stranded-DNA-specific exonuclease
MTPHIVRRTGFDVAQDSLPGDMNPLLWRLYRARGVRDPDQAGHGLNRLLPPTALGGVDAAAGLLEQALRAGWRILVVGDFDADGATSCALAVEALRAMGHSDVDFLVPNRFQFGYGLTPEIVDVARGYAPDLLVTVDNGISSIDGVAAAKALGWQVLVTDHHVAGAQLPAADVLVNPNLPGDPFPSKSMAGVGVIFYVLAALRGRLRQSGWFAARDLSEPRLADFLDLVALGTVADVVPLDHNNRVMVHQGLARIRSGRCRPGITALLQVAGRDPARVRASDLAFYAGPRLNAAGRLDDMTLGIRCLLSPDDDTAMRLAGELDRLNRARRDIEDDMRAQAEKMLGSWDPDASDDLPWGLCLHHADWHQGVIGILASRIKERLHRPVIVFADGDDGQLRGSARSIRPLHIRDALDRVATEHPGLLRKFGGHAMAAGLTIRSSDLAAFGDAFDRVCRDVLAPGDLRAEIVSDGPLPVEALALETVAVLDEGGPWGQGFEEPVFDGLFDVIDRRIVGERHWRLTLRPVGSDRRVNAIAFQAVETNPELPDRIHAAYQLDRNEWQGRVSLQLRLLHLAPAPEAA